jgi:hypothetical protein
VKKLTGTMTTKGFIHYYDYKGIQLPVRVKKCKPENSSGPRPPVIVDDCLVFVLPGGEDFISEREL